MSHRSAMEQPHADRRRFSDLCCSQISGVSGHSTEINKKRKLVCEYTESESPVSKQKLENQQVMELAELSENSVIYPVINNVHSASHPYMESDWYSTSSSSCSNEATSSSTFGSSLEFDSGANTDNVESRGTQYGCKEFFKEIEALHDPEITELAKSSMGVYEDPDADTFDSMASLNSLDDFGTRSELGGAMQDGRAVSRTLTIDQEFEQYFSHLML